MTSPAKRRARLTASFDLPVPEEPRTKTALGFGVGRRGKREKKKWLSERLKRWGWPRRNLIEGSLGRMSAMERESEGEEGGQ